jgi:type I restriction enzyme, S subunit
MEDWKTFKLRDFAELRKEQIKPNGDDLPYIGLEHIEQQSMRLNGVGSSKNVISNKYKFYSGDILYGKLRPYFRKVYKPNFTGVCSTDIYVIKNKQNISNNFLYYLIASENFTRIANSGSTGTKMPRADWNQIEKSEWKVPTSLSEQESISFILSSLDHKIELNLQMNKTLEAIAQTIFKEWFIEFRFPGLDGELVNGLPKGWRKVLLGKLCKKITKGTTPTTLKKDFVNKGINFIKVESIEDHGNFLPDKFAYIDHETNQLLKRSIVEENDILFTIAGTLGRVAKVDKSILPANTNQAVAIIRIDNPKYINFIYLLLKSELFKNRIQSKAVHAVQANISLGVISESEVIIPDNKMLDDFDLITNSILNKIMANTYEVRTLTSIRNTLLPKLMTGKIRVA